MSVEQTQTSDSQTPSMPPNGGTAEPSRPANQRPAHLKEVDTRKQQILDAVNEVTQDKPDAFGTPVRDPGDDLNPTPEAPTETTTETKPTEAKPTEKPDAPAPESTAQPAETPETPAEPKREFAISDGVRAKRDALPAEARAVFDEAYNELYQNAKKIADNLASRSAGSKAVEAVLNDPAIKQLFNDQHPHDQQLRGALQWAGLSFQDPIQFIQRFAAHYGFNLQELMSNNTTGEAGAGTATQVAGSDAPDAALWEDDEYDDPRTKAQKKMYRDMQKDFADFKQAQQQQQRQQQYEQQAQQIAAQNSQVVNRWSQTQGSDGKPAFPLVADQNHPLFRSVAEHVLRQANEFLQAGRQVDASLLSTFYQLALNSNAEWAKADQQLRQPAPAAEPAEPASEAKPATKPATKPKSSKLDTGGPSNETLRQSSEKSDEPKGNVTSNKEAAELAFRQVAARRQRAAA